MTPPCGKGFCRRHRSAMRCVCITCCVQTSSAKPSAGNQADQQEQQQHCRCALSYDAQSIHFCSVVASGVYMHTQFVYCEVHAGSLVA